MKTIRSVREKPGWSNLKGNMAGKPSCWLIDWKNSRDWKARITILGYLQRGGTPTASDRVLATQLGTHAADLIAADKDGVMVAFQGGKTACVPFEEVIGKEKKVPLDHPWINSARHVGTFPGRLII